MKFDIAINILIALLFIGVGILMYISISKSMAFKQVCYTEGGIIYKQNVYRKNSILRCVVDDEVIMVHQYYTKDLRVKSFKGHGSNCASEVYPTSKAIKLSLED